MLLNFIHGVLVLNLCILSLHETVIGTNGDPVVRFNRRILFIELQRHPVVNICLYVVDLPFFLKFIGNLIVISE
jgi:hypothetical protein